MPFRRHDVEQLLVRCHRRCCICHRYCGVKIETDHIVQGGSDDIANAIPVCFECHAEIHGYNERHPRGRKFTAEELREHRDQWLRICDKHPEVLVAPVGYAEVGPVQALIDELEFNERVAERSNKTEQGGLFQDEQFRRAIATGSIALLEDALKNSIVAAYVEMAAANQIIGSSWRHEIGGAAWAGGTNEAQQRIVAVRPKITAAKNNLVKFLGSETG